MSDAAPSSTPAGAKPQLRREHLWVTSTYFAEGFPYAIVNNLADIMFKQLGASLQVVGLTSLFHLPWNLKFLWGPFVDEYETKRRWLLGTELVITLVVIALALVATGAESSLVPLAAGFMVLAVLSATHDIAIDGFYLEALDERDQANFVGYRAAAYKAAVLLIGGPMLALCGSAGWTVGLLGAAVVMAAITAVHVVLLPRREQAKRSWVELGKRASVRAWPLLAIATALMLVELRWSIFEILQAQLGRIAERWPWLATVGISGWIGIALLLGLLLLLAMVPRLRGRLAEHARTGSEGYGDTFVSFLAQPKVGLMLAFVLLFRTGESFLMKMRWPFLSDVVGVGLDFYGHVNGTLGMVASFAATIIGGRLIAKHGLRRWIWPFVLAQNLLNLLYMGLAMAADPAALSPVTVAAVITIEHIGAGFGTAVFMVYLMRACDPAHKAGHFAIVSALMSLSFTLAGVFSGFLAEQLGFSLYFAFTFVATIPSMILIGFVPHLDGRETRAD